MRASIYSFRGAALLCKHADKQYDGNESDFAVNIATTVREGGQAAPAGGLEGRQWYADVAEEKSDVCSSR